MSRDLTHREIEAYGYVLGWIEDWRVKRDMAPGREAARQWWMEVAKSKERPEWQMRQWAEGGGGIWRGLKTVKKGVGMPGVFLSACRATQG